MGVEKKTPISIAIATALGVFIGAGVGATLAIKRKDEDKSSKNLDRIEHNINTLNTKVEKLSEKLEKKQPEKIEITGENTSMRVSEGKKQETSGQHKPQESVIYVRKSTEFLHYM